MSTLLKRKLTVDQVRVIPKLESVIMSVEANCYFLAEKELLAVIRKVIKMQP